MVIHFNFRKLVIDQCAFVLRTVMFSVNKQLSGQVPDMSVQ